MLSESISHSTTGGDASSTPVIKDMTILGQTQLQEFGAQIS